MLSKEREKLLSNWLIFERAYALKTPVMEAEFAHDERSALSLYDCLIPRIREHRRLKIQPDLQ